MKHLLNCSWPLSKKVNTRRGQVIFRRNIYEQISVKLYNNIYDVSQTVSLGLVTRGTTITIHQKALADSFHNVWRKILSQ